MVRLKIKEKKDIQRNNCVHSALTQLTQSRKCKTENIILNINKNYMNLLNDDRQRVDFQVKCMPIHVECTQCTAHPLYTHV